MWVLTLKEFSLPLFWFPLVKKNIENLFSQFFEDKAIEKLNPHSAQHNCIIRGYKTISI